MSARLAKATFWAAAGGLVFAQAGYPLALRALPRRPLRPEPGPGPGDATAALPTVCLVIAAYTEEDVIAEKVANARALDYPRERLQVVVACDGSPDATAERARAAGADVVLELPRGGKVAAQDAAVAAATADIVAFSDANALLEPDALRELVAPFADPGVGYVCGQVSFVNPDGAAGTNQEGLYWRYEMWLRAAESERWSVTAGNGAIYATRREDYVVVDPVMGHDLMFPFTFVRRGRRAVYAPAARATEKMVPSIEGEWQRKRRMMSHAWAIILRGGLLDPRGFPPPYLLMLVGHRYLRYGGPFLHLAALATAARLARSRRHGAVYRLALAAQLALLGAAAAGPRAGRAGLVARYYTLTTASIAAGLHDHLRHGTTAGWDAAEGTR
ncbi:glycosyltransferase [Paraconexibacter antarcticus]|uniref:Glycosyltransferase n=1 Tax=Paraconexibacter antarcticus TaxID=2949664 RepID=A0ABY5DSR4_9ACTN|nr:glycosyltransferase [Paraconexibacter antarcticus]UTI64721.1 glycosyltransferase [Paraconexibacter antarcticus]